MKYIFFIVACLVVPFLILGGLIYFLEWYGKKQIIIQNKTRNKDTDLYQQDIKRAEARRKIEEYYATSTGHDGQKNFVANKNQQNSKSKEIDKKIIDERKERDENYRKYLIRETNQERINRKQKAEVLYESNKLKEEREQNYINYAISETNSERKKRKEKELALKRNKLKKSIDQEKKIIFESEELKNAQKISNDRMEQKINLNLYGKKNTNDELVKTGFLKKIWSPREGKYIYDSNFEYDEYKKNTKKEINQYWENIINEPKIIFWNTSDKNKINPCPNRCKSSLKEEKWLYKNLERAVLESHRMQKPYICPSGFGYHIKSVKD